MRVFLVGMPGSGKTTIGKEIGHALKLTFFDLDDVIEEGQQRSIEQIFSEEGQQIFREIERNLLIKTIRENSQFVMACGGGTPCFFDNMERINEAGRSFYLSASVNELDQRLGKKGSTFRPLLHRSGVDRQEILTELLNERLEFYERAHYKIKSDETAISEILRLLNPDQAIS